MTYLHLEPCVSYGIVGERIVFLDLRRDRYLALDPPTEDAFRDLLATDQPLVSEGPARDRLLATGLFREGSLRGRLAPAHAPAPQASLLDERSRPRTGWIAPLRVWTAVTHARKRLAGTGLDEIVDAIREARYADPPEDDGSAAEDAARAFLAGRALVPVERSCLLDALALLDWLGDDAGHARLVFGVRMDPFGAHCWLQTDRTLLTDAHDTIGQFVPVLVA